MKTLKLFTLLLIITFNSGCFFLENVIPPEWYADNDQELINKIWISHLSSFNCETDFFCSLNDAENDLTAHGILTYGSKEGELNSKDCQSRKCMLYSVIINEKDLPKLSGTFWYYNFWLNTNRNHDYVN
jgi:hypothetical protein